MMIRADYVQYGCGLCAPPEWTNFDISPTLRVQRVPVVGRVLGRVGPRFPANVRYGDIVRGLPVPAGSCAAVYCSHTLEHLALDDFRTALRNTLALLRPGGTFRFVLPNLEQLARDYLDNPKPDAAIRFFEDAHLGMKQRPRGFKGFIREWLGNSRHLWMWDYKGLAAELAAAGFTDTRRAEFGDSPDPMFKLVEDAGRWDRLAVGVDCRRPGGAS
jgi:SAM-dependent methyltransferase